MAYLPPLNGGRINASISGNTTGTAALVSTGTLALAGGNNITLSQSGNTITISGGAGGGGINSLGMSNLGNTSGTTGIVSGSAIRFNFAGGNNITLSQSINASSATITISAASQSVQTFGMYAAGNTTQSSSTTFDARSFSVNGLGGLSAGYSAGSMQLSAPVISSLSVTGAMSISNNGNTVSIGVPAYSAGISTIGNTSGTTGFATNRIVFAGGTNITLSQSTNSNGNTLSIIGGGGGGGGIALVGGASTYSSGTVSLTGVGALTVSNGASVISLSVPGVSSISATGALSVSTNGSIISIGAPNMIQAGVSSLGNTMTQTNSSHTGMVSNRIVFAGGSNISLAQSTNSAGATVSIIGGAGGGGGAGVAIIPDGLAATYSSGSLTVSAAGALTLSTAAGPVLNFSVPQVSSIYGSNGISIITSGNTITISGNAGTGASIARWEAPNAFAPLSTQMNGTLSLQHLYVPFNVQGTAAKIGGSLSAGTNTSATTAFANMSLWMGIYTLNGSTLSLISGSTGSANNSFAYSQSASTTANTSINGMRQLTVPMSVNMTPGEYWIGAVISSQTTYVGASLTLYGNSLAGSTAGFLAPIGSNTTAGRDAYLGQGIYTAATSAGPASIALSGMNNVSNYAMRAAFYHVIYSATY